MRIVAGRFRGRTLAPVGKGDAGARLRPTADRVRESLFNVLAHRGAVTGARVLDLFAGTGALGYEALSRGAIHVCFVDNGRAAGELITRNAALMSCADEIELLRRDATRLEHWPGAPFDLVFLDPPYGRGMGQSAVARATAGGWIAPGALIVWEENAPMEPPGGFGHEDQRRYGDTHVTFLRRDVSN